MIHRSACVAICGTNSLTQSRTRSTAHSVTHAHFPGTLKATTEMISDRSNHICANSVARIFPVGFPSPRRKTIESLLSSTTDLASKCNANKFYFVRIVRLGLFLIVVSFLTEESFEAVRWSYFAFNHSLCAHPYCRYDPKAMTSVGYFDPLLASNHMRFLTLTVNLTIRKTEPC